MTFGERLTELRKENGYNTRNEFAEILGIPSTTLRNYETDVREPGHTFLKQISEFFNVSVDYLLCLTDEKEVLNSFRLHSSEHTLIEKYRSLDPFGRETVDYILDRELTRTQQLDTVCSAPTALRLYTYVNKIACAGNGFYFEDIPTDQIEAPELPGTDFIIGVSGDSMEPTFQDGDLLYVQKAQIVETGEIGIFMINNECFVKEAGPDGLLSHNPTYDMIPGSDDIICVGKVLGKVEC